MSSESEPPRRLCQLCNNVHAGICDEYGYGLELENKKLREELEYQRRAWQWFKTGCHVQDAQGVHTLCDESYVKEKAAAYQARIMKVLGKED